MKYCQQWFEYLLILLYLYIQNLPRQHKQYHRPHHKDRFHRRRHHHSILLLTLLDQNFQLWQTQNLENLMMRILQKTMSLQIHSIGYCWNQTRYLLQFHRRILQFHPTPPPPPATNKMSDIELDNVFNKPVLIAI